MTARARLGIFGLVTFLALSVYFNVRAYETLKKQKQVIVDLITLTLQYDNALRSCQNPISTGRISTTEYHPQ
jgi:hypothetical protein